ncbi:MAG: hypothetical protein M3Q52_11855 [Pseudomonadota bacterium]|nr:hypothetical protein [Pseudomonadota bacterium]
MTQDTPQVAAARVKAVTARARLMETARELQNRISPRNLAQNAWEGAKLKGADIAEDAVDAVRARPIAATGIVAALALFLAREPLRDLAAQMADGVSSKRDARRARKSKKKDPNETKTETVE